MHIQQNVLHFLCHSIILKAFASKCIYTCTVFRVIAQSHISVQNSFSSLITLIQLCLYRYVLQVITRYKLSQTPTQSKWGKINQGLNIAYSAVKYWNHIYLFYLLITGRIFEIMQQRSIDCKVISQIKQGRLEGNSPMLYIFLNRFNFWIMSTFTIISSCTVHPSTPITWILSFLLSPMSMLPCWSVVTPEGSRNCPL